MSFDGTVAVSPAGSIEPAAALSSPRSGRGAKAPGQRLTRRALPSVRIAAPVLRNRSAVSGADAVRRLVPLRPCDGSVKPHPVLGEDNSVPHPTVNWHDWYLNNKFHFCEIGQQLHTPRHGIFQQSPTGYRCRHAGARHPGC
jgi:hypothetical protein